MRRAMGWLLAALGTAVLLLGLRWLSAAPVALRRDDSARLRLSWTARPERIEVCRTLSAAELAQREEHMRQRVECDGRFASYALRVDTDGRAVHESVVRGAGLRHDRPLYVLREIDLPPGTHRVRVSFVRRERTDNDAAAFTRVAAPEEADTGVFAGRVEREAVERARRARAAIPPRLALDTTVLLPPDHAVVVSLDPEAQVLRLIAAPSP